MQRHLAALAKRPRNETRRIMGFLTDCVHAGQWPDEKTGAVNTPVFQTSTYKQDGIGKHRGYEYARTANPTREALERNVAALEKAKFGIAYSSGMAATDTILRLFGPGDEIVVTDNVYGGTYRLFELVLKQLGYIFKFVDTSDLKQVEAALSPKTKLVFLESPTNPMLRVSDIRAICGMAHARGATVCVDNTFMSPALQNPIDLGADIVVHSTTKFLNGHSDMVGGVVVLNDEAKAQKLRFLQNAVGAVPGPMDCFLALRGTKTLAVRMRQHEENARALAKFLASHKKLKSVNYPGLETHPQHELAKKQARGFGALISFDTGSLEAADRVLQSTKLFTLAESLGGVESLISHPATMTHGSVPQAEKMKLGVTPGLVRISVGIEDVEDLQADLDQALR
ncbi:MAG TPA: cystathionine gamma-synthase [Candidatus Krumholzibacteria bacterium]